LVKLLTAPAIEEIYRYVLTVDPSGERPMKWEVFEPALVGELASGEASGLHDDRSAVDTGDAGSVNQRISP
jgi:hypothetical protein